MPYVTVEEEIWVDLDDFETEDLIDEIRRRNNSKLSEIDYGGSNPVSIVNEIYMAKHVKKQDYDRLIDNLIYAVLGKIV